MNTLLTILLPASAFLLLAVYGAGIFPWTVITATVALCLAQGKVEIYSQFPTCNPATFNLRPPSPASSSPWR